MREMVYFTKPVTKSNSIGKEKRKIGANSSSMLNDPTTTTLHRVQPKLRLRKGEHSNIDLFRDQDPGTVPETFRERHKKTPSVVQKVDRSWIYATFQRM